MSSLIHQLRVALQLETAAFERGSKRAAAEVNTLGSRMDKSAAAVGRLGKATIAAGAVLAGSAIISQLKQLVSEGLEYASALGEQAKQLGVSTNALQQYRYAASQVGIEQDVMDKGLAVLTRRLGELATGTDKQRAALQRFGLSQGDVSKLIKMDAEQAIPFLADKYNELDGATRKAAFAAEFFGSKMGSQYQTLLAEGSKGINGLTSAAQRLGIVLSPEMIRNADDAADKMSALKMVLSAQIASVVAQNAKEITYLTSELAKFAVEALRAVNNWLRFRNTMGTRKAMMADASAYLDNRSDLSPETRAQAKGIARGLIDRRLGIKTTGVGGFWGAMGLKTTTIESGKLAGSGGFNRPLSPIEGWTPGTGDVDRMKAIGAFGDIASSIERVAPKADAATKSLRAFGDELGGLLDRLFPEAAAARTYRAERGLIDQAELRGTLSADMAKEARRRLMVEGHETTIGDRLADGDIPLGVMNFDQLQAKLQEVAGGFAGWASKSEIANLRVVRSFREMADGTIAALDRVTGAVRGGGFLDVLSSVIGLGLQLGSTGLFGNKIAANINATPRAHGGPTLAGRAYLVGERGPELFVSPGGGRIVPNDAMGGGNTYYFNGNLLTPEFWSEIHGRDVLAANAGGQIGFAKIRQRGQWELR